MSIDPLTIVITAAGEGKRMKAISPKPKHLLYFGAKRIIDCIREALKPFGPVEVIDGPPTSNRRETLERLRGRKNVLVCDCDVIPNIEYQTWRYDVKTFQADAIWYFISDADKYGGLWQDDAGRLVRAEERNREQPYRASGLYFISDVSATLDRMTDPDSLASGMIGAKMILEDNFIRVGDPEDYLNALK